MGSWNILQHAIGMALILSLLVACAAPPGAPEAVAASSEERISSPHVPRTDLRKLAAGNTAFAFDLYRAISDGEDNLF